jgi:xylan 1,4-beta-xylosidase
MNRKIPINVSEDSEPNQVSFGTLGLNTFRRRAFCPDLPETNLRIPSVRGPKWTLLPGVLAVVMAASASSQQTRVIHADMAKVTGPHSEVPLRVVGAGRAEEGLRADWQEQLATVQSEIGFKYLRMHGLLCDEMGVYTEDKQGNPQFNFQYVDTLYDALLKQHIRPFVELSFMPSKLASGTKTVFWWKGNVTPPKDPAKWAMLIRALLAHWKERYGEAEITQWYYEVWNEPDLKMFWSSSINDYFKLYKTTSEAVKAECPKCRVGGPAAAAQSAAEAFEKWVAESHEPVDFISEHTYAIKHGFVDTDGTEGTILDPDPDAVGGRMQHARELVKASALPNLELHITEWSSSYSPTDYMHDQYHQASFILDKVRRATPYVDSMSYWTFTDIFEEHGPPFTPFHGGFGLINLEGIKKPSFYAFKFLSQLGKDDVQTDDARSWVTKSPDGSMQVLVWDYSPVAPPTGQTDQTFYKLEQPATDLGSVEVDLMHVPNGRHHVALYQTGYKRNDAYTAYVEMHAPNQLTRAQVEALKKTSDGSPISETDVVVTDGHLMQQMALRTNDVFFLKITPLD